ncbi:MAG: hypothetical protein NT141_00820 [candidate division WWE3 bacterium]|nr:hypothetical protein [candidate division WWE3 bacterium]
MGGYDILDVIPIRAAEFYDAFSKWYKGSQLTKKHVTLVKEVLESAGFGSKISPEEGILYAEIADTNRQLERNSWSHLIVWDAKRREHVWATGWLDCAFNLVIRAGELTYHTDTVRHDGILQLVKEIRRSQPWPGIRFTKKGDCVVEPKPWYDGHFFVDHRRDGDKITNTNVGVHVGCNGIVSLHYNSVTGWSILRCIKCGTMVEYHGKAAYYKDLREFFTV